MYIYGRREDASLLLGHSLFCVENSFLFEQWGGTRENRKAIRYNEDKRRSPQWMKRCEES
ncbi:hypothetical protein JCM14450A_22340 [Geobacillus stearothermophilus]